VPKPIAFSTNSNGQATINGLRADNYFLEPATDLWKKGNGGTWIFGKEISVPPNKQSLYVGNSPKVTLRAHDKRSGAPIRSVRVRAHYPSSAGPYISYTKQFSWSNYVDAKLIPYLTIHAEGYISQPFPSKLFDSFEINHDFALTRAEPITLFFDWKSECDPSDFSFYVSQIRSSTDITTLGPFPININEKKLVFHPPTDGALQVFAQHNDTSAELNLSEWEFDYIHSQSNRTFRTVIRD